MTSLLGLVALDHWGVFGYQGNDWERFEGKHVAVIKAECGDTVVARIGNNGEQIRMKLLGVAAPALRGTEGKPEYWAAESMRWLEEWIVGHELIVRLEALRPRDASGTLAVYLYNLDSSLLNLAMVRQGQAYADRTGTYSLHALLETAESEARKKGQGLWKDHYLAESEMPAWRKAWLANSGIHPPKIPVTRENHSGDAGMR